MGSARQVSNASLGLCNIAKRQKKHTRVPILQASVEILGRLIRLPERLQQALPVRFRLNSWLWHPYTPSNTFVL